MNDRLIERALLLQHVGVVGVSLGVSYLLREVLAAHLPWLKPSVPTAVNVPLLLAYVPLWTWCADRVGLNRIVAISGPWLDVVRDLVWTQATALAGLALLLVAAQAPLNRSFLALHIVVSTVALLLTLAAQRPWVRRERGEVVTLVMGDEVAPAEHELRDLQGRRVERLPGLDAGALAARLHAGGVDEVVLPGDVPSAALRPLVGVCHQVGVDAFVRAERIAETGALPRAHVIGAALYLAYPVREPDRPALILKATFDRVVAAAGLLVLGPLMLAVAVLVRLTSAGPALFVQPRGGLQGRPFRMLKYRTMREGAEAARAGLLASNEMDGPVFKIRDDPRVTPVGRWLRRTSIDELPQLVNVLLGHMSLVGPRPLPLVETQALQGAQRRRLSMKPGITGLWQVSGRNELGFEAWMALDLQYVDDWSLSLDAAILLRTLPALLTARGAR